MSTNPEASNWHHSVPQSSKILIFSRLISLNAEGLDHRLPLLPPRYSKERIEKKSFFGLYTEFRASTNTVHAKQSDWSREYELKRTLNVLTIAEGLSLLRKSLMRL